jgi:hypothetical protein
MYLIMTVLNFLLPLGWMIWFWYLSMQFAGFPFASADAQQRLSVLGRLAFIWSVSRIMYAVVALTSVLQDWLTSAKQNRIIYSIVLVRLCATS